MFGKKTSASDAASYERACRLANFYLWAASVQKRRLESREREDVEFPLRMWMDFNFFVVALTRLRRTACIVSKIPLLRDQIERSIKIFDDEIPHLKKMRDVAEHIDEYALDSGRIRQISRKQVEVSAQQGTTWTWLEVELDIEKAFDAAIRLFGALKEGASFFAKKEPQDDFEPSIPDVD